MLIGITCEVDRRSSKKQLVLRFTWQPSVHVIRALINQRKLVSVTRIAQTNDSETHANDTWTIGANTAEKKSILLLLFRVVRLPWRQVCEYTGGRCSQRTKHCQWYLNLLKRAYCRCNWQMEPVEDTVVDDRNLNWLFYYFCLRILKIQPGKSMATTQL